MSCQEIEEKHKKSVIKIQEWPRGTDKEFDYNLFILMTLVILFSDSRGNTNIENAQLRFCVLLQRYLKVRRGLNGGSGVAVKFSFVYIAKNTFWKNTVFGRH